MTFEELVATAPFKLKRKLEQLRFLRERPDYHPENSTWEHIKIVTERLMQTGDPDLIMSGVFHDICKFDTARLGKNGYPTCLYHDEEARDLITISADKEIYREWIKSNGADPDVVATICELHMRFHNLSVMREARREARILEWKNLGVWEKLRFMAAADNMLVEFDINDLEKSFRKKD